MRKKMFEAVDRRGKLISPKFCKTVEFSSPTNEEEVIQISPLEWKDPVWQDTQLMEASSPHTLEKEDAQVNPLEGGANQVEDQVRQDTQLVEASNPLNEVDLQSNPLVGGSNQSEDPVRQDTQLVEALSPHTNDEEDVQVNPQKGIANQSEDPVRQDTQLVESSSPHTTEKANQSEDPVRQDNQLMEASNPHTNEEANLRSSSPRSLDMPSSSYLPSSLYLRSALVELVLDLHEQSEKSSLPHPYDRILRQQLETCVRVLEQIGDWTSTNTLANTVIVVIFRSWMSKLIAIKRVIERPKGWMPILLPKPDFCRLINDIDNSISELTLELLRASSSSERSLRVKIDRHLLRPDTHEEEDVQVNPLEGGVNQANVPLWQNTELVKASSSHTNDNEDIKVNPLEGGVHDYKYVYVPHTNEEEDPEAKMRSLDMPLSSNLRSSDLPPSPSLSSSLVELVLNVQKQSEKSPLPHPYNGILEQHLETCQRILDQMPDGQSHMIVVILRRLKTTLTDVQKVMEIRRRRMPILQPKHDFCNLILGIDNSKAELILELLEMLRASSSSDRQDTHVLKACSSPAEEELREVRRLWQKLCNEEHALRIQRKGQKGLKDKRKEILAFMDFREGQSPRSLPWIEVWNFDMLEFLFTVVCNDMDQIDKRQAGKVILAIASKDSNACYLIAKRFQSGLDSLIPFLASDSRPVLVELLSVFSKSRDLESQDAVVNGSGVGPLLEIVEDRESTWEEKKEAAVVLADVAKSLRAKKEYMEEVSFPRRAVQFLRTNERIEVRVEMVRALVTVMEGNTAAAAAAATLIRDANGLWAFAALLEATDRETVGHEITAVALTTLIGQDPGAAKQALGEERLLSLLCQCRRPAPSEVVALELINELLEEETFRGSHIDDNTRKRLIVQEDFQAFQSILTHGSAKAKEFTVTILRMLSRAHKDDSIVGVLFKYQIWELLFSVIEDSSSSDLAVEYAIRTVRNLDITAQRNLSLSSDVMSQMEPKQVMKMLMGSIRRHDANASIVHVAVKTLERFVLSVLRELCEPSNVHVLVSLLGRWEGETELLHSTVHVLGKLANETRFGGQLCKIMLDYGASQYLRTMLTSNGEGKAEGRDYIKDTSRLLTWLVTYAPRRSPALDDLRGDSVAIESIQNLEKTESDPGWKGAAVRALSKLK